MIIEFHLVVVELDDGRCNEGECCDREYRIIAAPLLWNNPWPLRGALNAESPKKLKYKKCQQVT